MASYDGQLMVWDIKTKKNIFSSDEINSKNQLLFLEFCQNSGYLIGTQEEAIYIFDLQRGQRIYTEYLNNKIIGLKKKGLFSLNSAWFNPDDGSILLGYRIQIKRRTYFYSEKISLNEEKTIFLIESKDIVESPYFKIAINSNFDKFIAPCNGRLSLFSIKTGQLISSFNEYHTDLEYLIINGC